MLFHFDLTMRKVIRMYLFPAKTNYGCNIYLQLLDAYIDNVSSHWSFVQFFDELLGKWIMAV